MYNNNVILQNHYNYEAISNNRFLTRISEEKIGNDGKSFGFGININNIICYERSYSSNYTTGFYYQIGGFFTFGISYGNYDTLTINVGVQHELETQSINISVRGVGVMLVAQSIPIHYNKCIQMGPAIALSVVDYRYNNSFF